MVCKKVFFEFYFVLMHIYNVNLSNVLADQVLKIIYVKNMKIFKAYVCYINFKNSSKLQ